MKKHNEQSIDETNEILHTDESENTDTLGTVAVKSLRLRSTPEIKTDNVKCCLTEGTTLLVSEVTSDNLWLKVYTEAGDMGYCMAEYVHKVTK